MGRHIALGCRDQQTVSVKLIHDYPNYGGKGGAEGRGALENTAAGEMQPKETCLVRYMHQHLDLT